MAYDALAESTALIEHGLTEDPRRLSRRRRFAALAVDVDGDVACTLFAVRAPGHVRRETHLLARTRGVWSVLGGGSGGGGDGDGLTDRPGTAELGAPVIVRGSGSVARSSGLMPWSTRYVHDAELSVSSAVHSLLVGGSRVLPVPRHGQLVVVWAGRRPPPVLARDVAGRPLGEVPLTVPSRMPGWYRAAPPGAEDEPGPDGH